VVGLGVGAGAYYNPATALLTRAFDGSGGAIGTHRSGGQVAGVFAPVAAAVLAIRYGWRPTIAVGGVLVAVVAGLFLWRSTASEPVHPDASLAVVFDPGTFRGVLSRPHARNTTILMTLVEFAELAAMAFFPTFLVEHYGFALGDANLLFAAFFTVSPSASPSAGGSPTAPAATRPRQSRRPPVSPGSVCSPPGAPPWRPFPASPSPASP